MHVVDCKTLRGKLSKLRLLHIAGQSQARPVLHSSRHHVAEHLWHSPSARAVLEASADVHEAYKRLVSE